MNGISIIMDDIQFTADETRKKIFKGFAALKFSNHVKLVFFSMIILPSSHGRIITPSSNCSGAS